MTSTPVNVKDYDELLLLEHSDMAIDFRKAFVQALSLAGDEVRVVRPCPLTPEEWYSIKRDYRIYRDWLDVLVVTIKPKSEIKFLGDIRQYDQARDLAGRQVTVYKKGDRLVSLKYPWPIRGAWVETSASPPQDGDEIVILSSTGGLIQLDDLIKP